jgi:integrase
MKIDLVTAPTDLARPIPMALQWAGQIADNGARRRAFADYQQRKSSATLRQQQAGLAGLRAWLKEMATDPGDLYADPESWAGLTWGLVADFIRFKLGRGYAVATVNNRLSTIKRYAALAMQAGALDPNQYAMIRAITGYAQREGRNLDQQRSAQGVATRTGAKAALPVLLDPDQAALLKQQPDTPQGRRDALLICLLLDHGLRCGEVAGLVVSNLSLKTRELTFYRPKVDKVQTHRLTADTARAARAYLVPRPEPVEGGQVRPDPARPLLLASRKSGQLHPAGMQVRAITKRVTTLGARIGVAGLSAHDLRHYWATLAARKGTNPFALQEAGGWASLAMPRRYIEAARIANQGVLLE